MMRKYYLERHIDENAVKLSSHGKHF